jgi:orotate phosphoribosyltransferase
MKIDDEIVQYMKAWLYDYINHNCIYRVGPEEDPLPPLHPSHAPDGYTWMILSRRGLLNGKFLNYTGMLFWHLFGDKFKQKPFQIAGLETACIPIISAIAMTAEAQGIDVNCFYVRKSPKDYGLKQDYEGFIEPDLPVLVVDDFYNSRSTFLRVKEFVENKGLSIYSDAFAIINKQWELYDPDRPDAHRLYMRAQAEGINIVSLFNITEFDLSYIKYQLKYGAVQLPNLEDYTTITI